MIGLDAVLEDIVSRLERIEARQLEIAAAVGIKDTVDINDLARRIGCGKSTLYKTPWELPNYGRPDFGEGVMRWWKATADAWYSKSTIERRAAWEAMSADERARVQGRAA